MIKINLFDYRTELNRIGIQKRVVGGVAVWFAAVTLCGLAHWMETIRLGGLKSDIAVVEVDIAKIQGKVKFVKKMKTQQVHLKGIISRIQSLRNDVVSPARFFDDVNGAVPEGLWMKSLQQLTWTEFDRKRIPMIFIKDPAKAKAQKKARRGPKVKEEPEFIEIEGWAFTDKSVAQFVNNLDMIPYFNIVFLHQSLGQAIKSQAVRKFTIYCYMGNQKAQA